MAFLCVYEDLCEALETTVGDRIRGRSRLARAPLGGLFVMSIEKGHLQNGGVAWRVRWREGGHNRVRQFSRKRDAEGFDADIPAEAATRRTVREGYLSV